MKWKRRKGCTSLLVGDSLNFGSIPNVLPMLQHALVLIQADNDSVLLSSCLGFSENDADLGLHSLVHGRLQRFVTFQPNHAGTCRCVNRSDARQIGRGVQGWNRLKSNNYGGIQQIQADWMFPSWSSFSWRRAPVHAASLPLFRPTGQDVAKRAL